MLFSWRTVNKLNKVNEQVKEGEMLLSSYTFIHSDAKITEQEKTTLIYWADEIRKNFESKYPMDSLLRKKRKLLFSIRNVY
jgi:hypothetical protein